MPFSCITDLKIQAKKAKMQKKAEMQKKGKHFFSNCKNKYAKKSRKYYFKKTSKKRQKCKKGLQKGMWGVYQTGDTSLYGIDYTVLLKF